MLNMALEGMMLSAALGGVACAGFSGSVWIGLLGAIIVGVIMGRVIAFSNLSGKTDLYLTCIAVNLAATGGTVFAMFLLTGEKSTTSAAIRAYTLPSITIPADRQDSAHRADGVRTQYSDLFCLHLRVPGMVLPVQNQNGTENESGG